MEQITLHRPHEQHSHSELIEKYFKVGSVAFQSYLDSINSPEYVYWDKAKFKPVPEGYSSDEAWLTAQIIRQLSAINSPVTDVSGAVYSYAKLPHFDQILHEIDLAIGGSFLVKGGQADDRQKFLTRGIIEEAIASSQLEGASTTRRYARKMIAENRKPRSVSERMIFNNYITMNAIEETYKSRPLSMDLLMEIHASLTVNTLERASDAGRLREESDVINVVYRDKIAHTAPSRAFVDQELPKLITYANDESEFIHPIIKASILHFWVGYLHPFADGNGRLARSLFYWYLFKHDYWGVAFVPISMILKRAQSKYTYAYIYSEQDNKDLTYFIDFSLSRVRMALAEFAKYVEGLESENKLIDTKLRSQYLLNDRQKQIIYYLTADESHHITESSHRIMSGIARGTARADLQKLFGYDLLTLKKDGRSSLYFASPKLRQLVLGDAAAGVYGVERQSSIFDALDT